jgi:glycosyltransferase involved in cell wall biosynthesis
MEQTFIEPELPALAKVFGRIILVPHHRSGKRLTVPVAAEVCEGLAAALDPARSWRNLRDGIPFLFRDRARGILLRRPRTGLRAVFRATASAGAARAWSTEFLKRFAGAPAPPIFYSYWFDDVTAGLLWARGRGARFPVVTRAHSGDLYEFMAEAGFFWGREFAVGRVDRIFPDSRAGTAYLRERFPHYGKKIYTARLGVPTAGTAAAFSIDGVFRILSCSFLIPRKRVGLLAGGIRHLARTRPPPKIHWRHVGDGSERETLQKMVVGLLVEVFVDFVGGLSPEEFWCYYKI